MKRIPILVVCAVTLIVAGYAMGQQLQKAPEFRRVVTKLDSSSKAVVMFDGQVEMMKSPAGNPFSNVWVTQSYPADFSWTEDRGTIKLGLTPPKNGTLFRIFDILPISPEIEARPIDTVMKMVGANAPAKGLPPKHPLMHRTRTVDYAIIMSGEIDMMLDDSVVHLKAGDVVVQQGTNHAWINRGKEPCRIAFVLMDAQEP